MRISCTISPHAHGHLAASVCRGHIIPSVFWCPGSCTCHIRPPKQVNVLRCYVWVNLYLHMGVQWKWCLHLATVRSIEADKHVREALCVCIHAHTRFACYLFNFTTSCFFSCRDKHTVPSWLIRRPRAMMQRSHIPRESKKSLTKFPKRKWLGVWR